MYGDLMPRTHIGSNENKMSRRERERRSLRIKAWKSWEARSYGVSRSAHRLVRPHPEN
jgi:hypothetical protein